MPRKSKIIVRLAPKSAKQEPTAIGRAIRFVGGAGGKYLGSYLGQPALGGAAGTQIGALVSKWLGFGDYRVSRNSILTNSAGTIPAMHKNNQSIIVRHKEYIGPVTSSINFSTLYEMPLNPGMVGTFPWLSPIAQRFQEYAFKGVVFHYIPASGSAISGTNPALGTVMLQTTYRASDTGPTSKTEMLNEYCASENVPCEAFIHPIECDPRENPFNIHYVRSAPPPTGEPLLSYDLGKTFVAVQGQQANGSYLGDLWVTYEVEFKKPIINSDIVSGSGLLAKFASPTAANPFATLSSLTGDLNLVFANNTITFPPGLSGATTVIMQFAGSLTSLIYVGTTSVTNGDMEAIDTDGNKVMSTQVSAATNPPITGGCFVFRFRKRNPNLAAVLTVSPNWTFTGTITSLNVYISREAE